MVHAEKFLGKRMERVYLIVMENVKVKTIHAITNVQVAELSRLSHLMNKITNFLQQMVISPTMVLKEGWGVGDLAFLV